MSTPRPPGVELPVSVELLDRLVYLLDQYDRLLECHRHVSMDTTDDRKLHSRVIAQFERAAEPVRETLKHVVSTMPRRRALVDGQPAVTE